MWHSCDRFTLKELFAKCDPAVLRLFRRFEKMVRACGPVTMVPQKTRVVFMVRVRHVAVYPHKNYLLCSLALPKRQRSLRFSKIEKYTSRFIGHYTRIDSEDQLDAQLQRWLHESYAVGKQDSPPS